jgi:uncharacterized membrane protein
MFGYALIIMATLGRIWCAVYIAGRKNKELCQDGPYSLVRHPLYSFSFLGAIGVTLAVQSLLLTVIVTPLFLAYHHFVINSEERRLQGLFGDQFTRYRLRVSRLVPRLGSYWSRQMIQVDPRIVFRSMVDASFFMWLLVALEMLEYARGIGVIPTFWQLPW